MNSSGKFEFQFLLSLSHLTDCTSTLKNIKMEKKTRKNNSSWVLCQENRLTFDKDPFQMKIFMIYHQPKINNYFIIMK